MNSLGIDIRYNKKGHKLTYCVINDGIIVAFGEMKKREGTFDNEIKALQGCYDVHENRTLMEVNK